MDYALMTAPCGLDCFNCPMVLANKDADLKMKIAANLGIPWIWLPAGDAGKKGVSSPFRG